MILLLPLLVSITESSDYAYWWGQSRGWIILFRTTVFVSIGATFGMMAALLVGRSGMFWAMLACLPLLIPSSLLGTLWIATLGNTGPLSHFMTVYEMPVAAMVVGLRYFGIGALIFSVYRMNDKTAARIYPLQHTWWHLKLKPLLTPAIVVWLVLWILCCSDHIMPSLFLIHTYGTQVLIQYNALNDPGGAATIVIPLVGIGILMALIAGRLLIINPPTSQTAQRTASMWPALLILSIAVVLPIVMVIWRSGSITNWVDAFSQMNNELWHTAKLALITSPCIVFCGWLLAMRWHDSRQARSWSLAPLALLNLITPPSLIAFGMISLNGRWPMSLFRDNDFWLILSLICRFSPIAMLLFYLFILNRYELPNVAAKLFSITRRNRLLYLTWPSYRFIFLAALLLGMLLVATDLELSVLLTPAGHSTISVRLYTLIHTAPQQQVNSSAMILMIMIFPLIILFGISAWLNSRKKS